MPKKSSEQEWDAIIHAIALFPEGASLEKVLEITALPRRTLQRRLAFLTKTGRLQAEGRTQGRRYWVTSTKNDSIPLSSTALSIHAQLKQPLQSRPHVSYNREFLDAYRPNVTYYLSTEMRLQLAEWGKSPSSDRPAGTFARQIYSRLLIDLSWNSSRLEGNTYSLIETRRLLELGRASEGKDAKETQMILNHKAAIEFLVESVESSGINRYTIFNLHALLANNLLADPSACGRLRSIPVGIEKSVYHPLAVPQLIAECFNQILDTAQAIENPFEQAFFLMVHLPYLQPFEDVNKRVSRLAANLPLIQRNLSPLSFVDVSEELYISGLLGVYELNQIELLRDVFVWAYSRSSSLYAATRKALGEPDPFRMRYREVIFETVRSIVLRGIDKKTAVDMIREQAFIYLPPEEQSHFIEVVETEVLSLHEGNIARYKLSLSEYETWQKSWH